MYRRQKVTTFVSTTNCGGTDCRYDIDSANIPLSHHQLKKSKSQLSWEIHSQAKLWNVYICKRAVAQPSWSHFEIHKRSLRLCHLACTIKSRNTCELIKETQQGTSVNRFLHYWLLFGQTLTEWWPKSQALIGFIQGIQGISWTVLK
jgi:hypothetical protein